MRVLVSATLSIINSNGNWLLQFPWTENQFIGSAIPIDSYAQRRWRQFWMDCWWKSLGKYKTGAVCDRFKHLGPQINWFRTIWSKKGIHKHNFSTWLFTLNCYSTRDRFIDWGLDPNCLLYKSALKSRDHFLLQCILQLRSLVSEFGKMSNYSST